MHKYNETAQIKQQPAPALPQTHEPDLMFENYVWEPVCVTDNFPQTTGYIKRSPHADNAAGETIFRGVVADA